MRYSCFRNSLTCCRSTSKNKNLKFPIAAQECQRANHPFYRAEQIVSLKGHDCFEERYVDLLALNVSQECHCVSVFTFRYSCMPLVNPLIPHVYTSQFNRTIRVEFLVYIHPSAFCSKKYETRIRKKYELERLRVLQYNAHLFSRRDICEFLYLSDSDLTYCGTSLVPGC